MRNVKNSLFALLSIVSIGAAFGVASPVFACDGESCSAESSCTKKDGEECSCAKCKKKHAKKAKKAKGAAEKTAEKPAESAPAETKAE